MLKTFPELEGSPQAWVMDTGSVHTKSPLRMTIPANQELDIHFLCRGTPGSVVTADTRRTRAHLQGRDGEGFAVAAVTRALPAVADFTQDRRGPRRLLRDVVRDHRGVGLEVRGGGVVVILRPE